VGNLLKNLAAIVVLLACGATAQAGSMRLSGTAGYLSEWEVRADLAPSPSGNGSFSGPLTVKHVGLCTPNGAVEKNGELNLVISKSVFSSRMEARLSFGGVQCTYAGPVSDAISATMDCSDAKGVPLNVTLK
jgi:hypothetical protein